MATKKEKIAIIRKIQPPVEMTDEELGAMKVDQLNEIIERKTGVKPAESTDVDEIEVPANSKAKIRVHFTLSDGKTRKFDEDGHGDDFVSVADEFHNTNKSRIINRIDE